MQARTLLILPRYQVVWIEARADLEGVIPTEADYQLSQVYRYHVYREFGCHLDEGIADCEVL